MVYWKLDTLDIIALGHVSMRPEVTLNGKSGKMGRPLGIKGLYNIAGSATDNKRADSRGIHS